MNKSHLIKLSISLLFLLYFSICNVGTNAFALPPFWTQEMQLSQGEAESIQPAVCIRRENIFVVWADSRINGNYELFFRFSSDGGLTWNTEERITNTETDSIQPAIVCGRNNLHLVWREKSTSFPEESTLYYSQWNGMFWSSPQRVSPNPENNPRRPDIAITQTDVVYIVWEEDSGESQSDITSTKAYFTLNRDGTFQRPKPITVGDWNTAEPKIDAGYRTVYVAWRDEREATPQIYTRQLGETPFDYDIRLSSSGNCSRPSISVLEPQVYVAYECRSNQFFPANIFVTESNDSGQNWKQIRQITSSTAESIRPVISVTSELVWLFWQDGESGNWNIHFTRKKEQNWSPSEKFMDSDKDDILPAIANSSGYQNPQFYLFWTREFEVERNRDASPSDVSKIFHSRRDTIPPKTPDSPLFIDENAKPGYDNDGVLTFFWIHDEVGRSQDASPDVAGYNIYAAVNGGDFEKIDSTVRRVYNLQGENGNSYQIRVEAFDSVGNTSELSSASEVIYVDSIPPYVEIHYPRANSTLVRPVPIIASCYDENLVYCRLKYGATDAPTIWNELSEPIRTNIDQEKILLWDNSGLQGVYVLNLVAFDEAGNQSSSKIPVIVDNLLPLSISPGDVSTISNLDIEATYRTPSFSFDGDAICFSSNEGGTEDIWVYSIPSRQRYPVTQEQNINFFPAFSPDSNWIVFQSLEELQVNNHQSTGWDIYIVPSEGGERIPLVQLESNEKNPVFSPSGRQLAFSSDLDGDEEIYILTNVMEVIQGAEPQLFQLTKNSYSDITPTWTPDETRVAFAADRFGNWDIFEVNIDGSAEKRLTEQLADDTFPKYSPDGKRILYLSNSSGTYNSVVAKSLVSDDSFSKDEVANLTMPGEDVVYADWAPDLQSIVYQVEDSIYFRTVNFPVEELKAVITRPYEGENLDSDEFDIKGIAKGDSFERYILEYSVLDSSKPTVWKSVGGYSTVSVESEDFLGRLDTSNLQGEYVIRLTIEGKKSVETDEVKVFVRDEYPSLTVTKPLNGVVSTADIIRVEGQAEKSSTVYVNDTEVELNENGYFSTQVVLNEGTNKIQIRTINPIGLESQVEREVIRDTQEPEITLSSPTDFLLVKSPYVTISGQVSEPADVEFSSEDLKLPLTLDENREFSYVHSLNEGTNEIRLKATDKAGFETELLRRVIYQSPSKITEDNNPPAITDVFPIDGITLDTSEIKVKALLVDDTEIDIDTLVFSFDGEQYIFDPNSEEATEFDGEIFSFDSETGEFSFVPEFNLADGEHSFTFDVMDEAGNSAESVNITFFIDIQPLSLFLSAFRNDSILEVSLASNKPLKNILEATVYPTSQKQIISETGYSLNLTQEGLDDKPFIYTGSFFPVPTYEGFILSSSLVPKSTIYKKEQETKHQITGFYTSGEFTSRGEVSVLELSIPDGPSASLTTSENTVVDSEVEVVLRSQNGFDLDTVAAQIKNAKDRNLKINSPIYELESSRELQVPVQIKLQLPSLDNMPHKAMFYWNEILRQWEPLNAKINAQTYYFSATLEHVPSVESAEPQKGIFQNAFSFYALLTDEQPPVIDKIVPEDGEDVSLDRFLVDIFFHDEGSGISYANLKVDGKSVDFVLDKEEGRLTYLPKNLEPGLHQLEISVYDRASNSIHKNTEFFTQDIFKFADEPISYPNPAKSSATISFMLTQSAEQITLEIYSITGELIYQTEMDGNSSEFVWQCENQYGKSIASGIYIYLLTAKKGDRKISYKNKIAVVK